MHIPVYSAASTPPLNSQPSAPFALHPVPHTMTLNASASVNTRRLSCIKKIAKQGEEKKRRREGSKKRSGAKKRLGSGEVQLFQSWLGFWQTAREGRQCNAVQIQESIDAHWSIGLMVGGGVSALFSKAKHRGHDWALRWLKPVGERG